MEWVCNVWHTWLVGSSVLPKLTFVIIPTGVNAAVSQDKDSVAGPAADFLNFFPTKGVDDLGGGNDPFLTELHT